MDWLIEDLEHLPLADRVGAVQGVLRLMRPMVDRAKIDCFSDVAALPTDAAVALDRLRADAPLIKRPLRRTSRTYMAVPVPVSDSEAFGRALAFAPYAIHAVLIDGRGDEIVVLHDTSTSITIKTSTDLAAGIRDALPPSLRIVEY